MLTPASAADKASLGALRAYLGARASVVDQLATTMSQHKEYWFAAVRVSDGNAATGQLRVTSPDPWASDQERLLVQTYGSVQASALASPRPGEAFAFQSSGRATKVYGFPRPGGVVVLTFASPRPEAGPGWDDIVGTFGDEGR